MSNGGLIVFTDLDGTLLDHETYSWAPAAPAVAALRDNGIPLILASSKTAAELAPLRDELGFSRCPAIVENGAGILEPGEDGSGDDGDHAAIRAALDELPPDLRAGFSGFSDWSVSEIAERTGLTEDAAARAARRRFSEPGLWKGTEAGEARFQALLAERGISARRGGRFLTLAFGATKADRMREIAARLDLPFKVALGDAPNDVEMLEAADVGVIVANPHREPLERLRGEDAGHIIRTEKPGPDGWNTAVQQILSRRGLHI